MSILHAAILVVVVVVLCPGLSRPAHGSGCFCEAAPQHRRSYRAGRILSKQEATRYYATTAWRGGATRPKEEEISSSSGSSSAEAYTLLARAVQSRLTVNEADNDSDGSSPATSSPPPAIAAIVNAFLSLSSAQKAFKGLDGAAHEAYQRTHHTSSKSAGDDDSVLSVQGRARRSAARTSAVAHALGACELCELIRSPAIFQESSLNANTTSTRNGTALEGRQVLLNVTDAAQLGKDSDNNNNKVSVLVLYEPAYQGGAGIHHGSIEDLADSKHDDGDKQHHPSRRRRGGGKVIQGRLLIVIGDHLSENLDERLFRILEQKPKHVRLHSGPEVASVQPILYQAAGSILTTLEPILRSHNTSAIHFVGRSLSGGIAVLAATMLDGDIPLPADKKSLKRRKQRQQKQQPSPTKTETVTDSIVQTDNSTSSADMSNQTTIPVRPLQGLGRGRTSALSLGCPPCLSANVPADFVTSILYGDDIICRASPESLERFFKRTRRALKRGGNILGKRLNWMADTMTLATSNLQSHAVGSEGEEARLATAGRAYLVRPRRLGGLCSMHEVGSQLKGGREALRAAVLWQLNDILLSRSLWKHHQLESYIHGIDRVQLRGLDDYSNNRNNPLDEEEDAESNFVLD